MSLQKLMRTKMKKLLIGLLFCLSTAPVANDHGDGHHKHAQKKHTISLTPELQALLNQEMHQIKSGMESLVLASVSGDWKKIASVGHQIKHSYILKQKLSDKQRHQLHEKLPAGFKQLDQKLHNYAGMLSHVAKEHDIELVNYYLYKMNETCASCHASYARDKFPGFNAKNKHASDKH